MSANKLAVRLLASAMLACLAGCSGGDASDTASLVRLEIQPTHATAAKGTARQLTAIATLSDSSTRDVTAAVSWSSADTGIAAVSNTAESHGLVHAVAVGSTTITGIYDAWSVSIEFTVAAAEVATLTTTPAMPTISDGLTQQFVATATFTDNTTQDVTSLAAWSSSDVTVAIVNSSGLAQSLRPGTTTISANYSGHGSNATLTVANTPTPVSPYYIPFIQTPSSSSGGGASGLFVIRSDEPTLAPLQITNVNTKIYAGPDQPLNDGSGNLVGVQPFSLVYSTSGSAAGDHIYALTLNASQPAIPKQISNASFSSDAPMCLGVSIARSLTEPDSTVLIYSTHGDDETCETADDDVHLVRQTDSASTSPSSINLSSAALKSGNLLTLHDARGDLSAIFVVNESNSLVMYKDLTFSNPASLLDNVRAVYQRHARAGYGFISLTSTLGQISLYRVTDAGEISANLYETSTDLLDSGVPKDDFLYFSDAIPDGDGLAYKFVVIRVPLDGSSRAKILAMSPRSGGTSATPSARVQGFIGSKLIARFSTNQNDGLSSIYALETSPSPGSLSSLLDVERGSISQTVIKGDRIFADHFRTSSSGLIVYATDILEVNGDLVTHMRNTGIAGVDYKISGTISPAYTSGRSAKTLYLNEQVSQYNVFASGMTLSSLDLDTLVKTPVIDAGTGQAYASEENQGTLHRIYPSGQPVIGLAAFIDVGVVQSGTDAMVFDAANNRIYRTTRTPEIDETPYSE